MQAKQLALTACLLAAPILAQTNSTPAASPDLYHGLADKKKPENVEIVPGLKIGALIELEAEYVNQDGTDSSDAYVATMELGADFQPVEWAEGHVLFKWEEDSDKDVELDEATVTLGNTEDIPFFISAGRQYLPFGVFNTHFVSDPLAQDIGETRATAIMAGYESEFLTISAGVFRGNQMDQDKVNNLVGSFILQPHEGIELGVYAISDMGESLTLLEEVREECADYDKVPGLGCYLSLEAWLLHLDAEFLTATKSFKPGVFDEEEEFKPCTWNVELALQPIERLQIAGKLEYGRELAPDMIERRLGGAASFGITEYLTVAAEYLHTRFENDKPDEDAVRMQLAAKF